LILKICSFLCFIFFLVSYFATRSFLNFLSQLENNSLLYFGQFYSYLGLSIFFILVLLALLPVGKKTIGSQKTKLGRFTWVSMLYSTGMGSGLLLRAVQEPLFYFSNPPVQSLDSLKILSLKYTFYHWGLTPWSFYCLFALILSYWHFNRKKELIVSSILTKESSQHLKSHIINSISAIATLIGVVAALCLGGSQWIKGIELTTNSQFTLSQSLTLILFIVCCSTISAVSGIYKSIRVLSIFNIITAFFIMTYVLLNGQVLNTFSLFISSYSSYLIDFIPMSLNIDEFKTSRAFLMDWTYFYWAFWLAWTPFTALFIARISEGRSFREFIFFTLVVPSIGTFLWFSIFASNIYILIDSKMYSPEQFSSIYDSLFLYLNTLPYGFILKFLALLNVLTFLITSIDSAIVILSFHSNPIRNKKTNVLWGALIAMTSIGILTLGNTNLLKIVSLLLVIMALPLSLLYCFAILIFIYNLWKHKNN
jgi:glycine betaine transporter